jgi:ATP-dependent helicase/nuclease subunit A
VETAGSLNDGLLAERRPAQLSAEESAKVAAAAETMRILRAKKDHVPIATLLGEALARTGYDAVLLAEFLGERKLANLHKLMERARAADNGVSDLDGFITQLAQFISTQPKEALAATLPETADVIRLMTIHHAKGLEFPLVIVPDLDRPPNIRTPCAALHRDLGPLVPWPVDEDVKVTTGMSLFAAMERSEELEERKRLLYVACTRAADYLVLSTSLAGYDEPKSDWMKFLAERFDLASGDLVGGLPAGYESPQVKVLRDPQTDRKPAAKSHGPDLLKVLEEARQLAEGGGGTIPPAVEPVPVDGAARRQFSFSQLTGELIAAEADLSVRTEESRDFTSPSSDARGFGSLVHDVLSRVEFSGKFDVAEWCRHLATEYIGEDYEAAADRASDLIDGFLASPRAQELEKARALHREVEFLLAWPPGETNGHGYFLRGVIDLIYQDADGRWHLVDYKTNHVSAADVPTLSGRYALQLSMYALAAERVLGQPPLELVLYFMQPGKEHVVPWNDEARHCTIEQLNKAIATATDWSLQ